MVVLLVMTGCRLFHILMVLNYYSVSQMYDLVMLGDRLDTVRVRVIGYNSVILPPDT